MWIAWSKPAPRLVVQIDYVAGRAPHSLALDALNRTLREQSNKPWIDYAPMREVDALPASYNYTEVLIRSVQLSRDFGSAQTTERTLLHIFYANGSPSDRDASGLYVGLGEIIIFPDTFPQTPAPLLASGSTSDDALEAERTALVHETGHAFGLVNRGAPMVRLHEDPDHPGHSSDTHSVMFEGWDETSQLDPTMPGFQLHGYNWAFDQDDLDDLAALRALEPS